MFAEQSVLANAYRIQSLIAATPLGHLFEAHDMLLERPVAILGGYLDDDATPLLPEARVLARIDAPCVAAVYGLGRHQGIEYVVAERIAGVSLAEHAAAAVRVGQPLPVAEVIALLGQLARALCALHRLGLWAPRMAPRNLILLPGKRIVLSEYAFAQGASHDEDMCLAPEIIRGVQLDDGDMARTAEAIDLYALGCVAVELLIGEPPFTGDSLKGLQQAHVYAPPPKLTALRDDVPQELADLVDELLAKRPQQRPQGPQVVLEQLDVIRARMVAQERTRVLLVDREHGRRARLASALRRVHAALDVDLAQDGEVAIDKMQRTPPDVLVFDMTLDGSMNGLELCMYVRGLDNMQRAVLVALCDADSPGDASVLTQLGVSHVLVRSEHTDEALARIALDHLRELEEQDLLSG